MARVRYLNLDVNRQLPARKTESSIEMQPHAGSELRPSCLTCMALVDTLPSNYWYTEHHYGQRILSNLKCLAHQLAHQICQPCNHVRPLAMKPHAGSELLPSRLASMASVDTLPSNHWCTEHHYSQMILSYLKCLAAPASATESQDTQPC